MKQTTPSRWRALWVLPPLAIGILVVLLMAGGRQPPAKTEQGETRYPVRVIEARAVDLVPQAEGYGEVLPEKVWAAVAQVAGRITEVHPQLRDGEILPRDTLLFRIDPVDYELKLAQARAELAELDVQEQNSRASLAIDERYLRLAEREKDRIAALSAKGTASKSDVDNAERSMLSARTAMQNTENTLALLPTQRRLLEARLTQAERDLANTSVRAPFNLRIADLAVEKDQYVGIGQTLFRGDAVDRVEIVAQLAMSSLRNLFVGRDDPIPSVSEMQTRLPDFTGFRPLVRMDLGNQTAEWEAEFVRFSDQVDPQTRTIGVVIAVDRPLEKTIPGRRPPLSKGMFVQVLIRGRTQAGRIVLPRSAVREGQVYLVDEQSRLQIVPVGILFHQGPLSVIADGVLPGRQVVISDLIPAVPGMLLDPIPDPAIEDEMLDVAGGAQ
jgi:RND family efflux transporter MFP subunit